MAERWLSLKATLAHRVPMTTERAVADCRDARGRKQAAAQERLRRIVDEANAFTATLSDGSMSQRQALRWQLAIEELTEFAGEALGR